MEQVASQLCRVALEGSGSKLKKVSNKCLTCSR